MRVADKVAQETASSARAQARLGSLMKSAPPTRVSLLCSDLYPALVAAERAVVNQCGCYLHGGLAPRVNTHASPLAPYHIETTGRLFAGGILWARAPRNTLD